MTRDQVIKKLFCSWGHMKKIEEYCMQDYLNTNKEKYFCFLVVENEFITSANKYTIVFYEQYNKHLYITQTSKSYLNRQKWLGTKELQDEAFHHCIKNPFEKGVVLNNDNHNIYMVKALYERFRDFM